MPSNIFVQTFARFKHTQTIYEIAQTCRKQLNINIYSSINLKVGDILHKFQHLENKYSKLMRAENSLEWKEDEKKTQNQWEDISQAFHNKNILLMKYEAKAVDKNCERVHWQRQQELLLCHCINSEMNGKWANISRYIFFESNGQTFKTPKQCRQHWFNHMNKTLKHGGWDVEQDLTILYSVLDYGHKWARIVDLLQGKRTEHMIKNRFHSLLTCSTKINQNRKQQKNQAKLIKIIINELTVSKIIPKSDGKIKLNNYKSAQQNQSIKNQHISLQENIAHLNSKQIIQCKQQQQLQDATLKEIQNELIVEKDKNQVMDGEYFLSNFYSPSIINVNPVPYVFESNLQTYPNTFFVFPLFMNIGITPQY